ncbi:hypothetical protein A2368_02095 [Candidatus Collierbacteria bacterium RIFOXYB1_FULL_49_13]|uniref:Peptidase MA-like domain-containing protein n=1 Tax=Candidatus Collierbacteria bacterium RIFOXYB1_FULL_49_13 TaxID=1817728 RepID=A0A1F5FGK5_9BACT|nr:MAG: hypothetical protein A2368_02095 [Candidatus Collierbacteria bacterium RIFOXYB1_FULL_49_13]
MSANVFLMEVTEVENPKIDGFYEEAMDKVGRFFGINWIQNRPIVRLVKDRKTIDILRRKQTSDWVVGFTDRLGIVLLHPDSFGTECRQKYSDEYYSELVAHEIAHLFYEITSGGKRFPVWLTEGISGYVSEQYIDRPVIKEFTKFLEPEAIESLYSEAPYAVKLLVDKYGRRKLLDLVKAVAKIPMDDVSFPKVFLDMYGLKLEYKMFNDLATEEV